jgi:beta-1,2-mannobiose phosphorylase / 1,2-beta-oligomannan phosphorylase
MWDGGKIGTGAPPIRTKDGWLLIYYGTPYDYVQKPDAYNPYLIGAMLLDLDDPTKVLYRSKLPILGPTEDYENNGFKAGVVFPCGAVVMNETLFVYYGGADSYVCVATANLADFLKKLSLDEVPVLEKAKIVKII